MGDLEVVELPYLYYYCVWWIYFRYRYYVC